jgi:hypothetical protein
MTQNDSPVPEGSELPSAQSPAVIWGGIALIVAIVFCTFNSSAMVLGAGFFAKLLAVIVGTVFGGAGALIGDAVRKFAQPDAVLTSGGLFQLVWLKLFWKIGPQTIGLLIGVILGCALVLR